MSYDLEVYGKVALSTRDLAKVVSADRALKAQVDKRADAVGAVVWKKSGAHFFTIDGPMQVEPEDLPEGWAEGEGATVLYSLSITYDVSEGPEGFSATVDGADADAAMAFAERLAARIDGAVWDSQTCEAPEVEVAPEAEPEGPRFLHLEWYYTDGDPARAADYLVATRAHSPSASPIRFGTHQPYSGRILAENDGGLDQYYRENCRNSRLVLVGKLPFLRGLISDWSDAVLPSVKVTFALADIRDEDVSALKALFVEFARSTGSFFACAEVNKNEFASAVPLIRQSASWPGLPRVPQWLTWLSPEYAQLVRRHLSADRLQDYPEGVLHTWGSQPVGAEEIASVVVRRETWLPAKFMPRQDDPVDHRYSTRPARRIPASVLKA